MQWTRQWVGDNDLVYLQGKTIDEVQGARKEGNYVFIEHATRHHAGIFQCLADDRSTSPQHEAIEIVVNCKFNSEL